MSKIVIDIPTALRQYADGNDTAEVQGETVGDALDDLTDQFGELKNHLYGDDDTLRNFVNVYLNDENIRHLDGTDTPAEDDDVISIIPAVAGGAPTGDNGQLSQEELERYSRHLIMPEVAMRGQKALREARVLVVGAGGLGSPLVSYLAAAGVGTLGVIDFDVVDFTNLQRQVIYSTDDVGRKKLDAATERINQINPQVKVIPHETRLTSENALDIIDDYDIVVDGTDNFPTRYLVNDACVLLGKPNVYGSIFRFEGQATVFATEDGPCYRCLYPEPPPPGLVPSCAEGGVLGVLPGIVGTIQATETIKLLIDRGESLAGRLLLFDALKMKFRELEVRKDPDCPVCGENPTVTELIDYEQFCGIRGEEEEAKDLGDKYEISPQGLKEKLDNNEDVFILDVRNPEEYEISRIEGSKLIPLDELPERIAELNTADDIVVHCRTGVRSAKAVEFMQTSGFDKVKNLVGGINAWAEEVDESLPQY
ncbi:MAG: molybdopterin-synthase adenylyltransferase MoeB [Candidatus Marinimicrobia bacterium]|nr:molybdopterin-synthase adenylyltransferase MoeB [Candidatus Neomarinimicrobiota bacterium]MCF7827528.1 molybdopterin-synthase adenylyltransferase MoeB [Candidatus Neomarinimicrobiota bacterium]MCF7881610.1 molybdopterin-synthase adenylyltransferase MoeB [Candidatus Neomarinimicrobiota bacterium]